jgi:hypothetical protein
MSNSLTLDDCFSKYGEPLYIGSKHLIWKDTGQNRAIKATRPGYFADGTIIITSQSWHEPADPSSPHPSTEEMADCMRAFGFRQANLNDWQRMDGTMAMDVKPGDFIKTKEGVVPIDVCLEKPKKQNA